MSFDWAEYLTLARSLVSQSNALPNQEAALRAAISRSYYAAFCCARNYLRDHDNILDIPLDGRAHKAVPDEFLSSSETARRAVGSDLQRLRSDRIHADYYDDFPVTTTLRKKADETLARADKVIRALASLPPRS